MTVPAGFCHEPLADWSREDNMMKMSAAVRKDEKELNKTYPTLYPLFIGGERVIKTEAIFSNNPASSGRIIGLITKANAALIHEAAEGAYEVWKKLWRGVLFAERADYLLKAAEIMRERRFDLASLAVFEVGKNWQEADADVAEAIDYLEFYARRMLELGEPKITEETPGELNQIRYVPRGVVAVIGVWNFPWAINVGMISAALVTGNTVVFKPASVSAIIGWHIVDIFRKAGVPDGVLNLIAGSGQEAGEELIKSPKVIGIAVTGSKETGLRIQQLCSQYPCEYGFKEIVAGEFGGKGKIIVDSDADLDEAVREVIRSAFGYSGQKCSACSVAIVTEDIYDCFLRRLTAAAKSIIVGRPQDPGSMLGPLISKKALEKVREYVEIGKREAKMVYCGEIPTALSSAGYYHPPVIFADVPVDARIAQEEIFGPVLSVVKAKNFDEAVEFFNHSDYALTGGIFSRLPSHVARAGEECGAGNFYINRGITGAMVGRQPFGGWKHSGVGSKAGSRNYLLRFLYEKIVTENLMRRGVALADC